MKGQFAPQDEEEFISTFDEGMNFGGWEDDELKVIVQGESRGIVEGHMYCSPDAGEDLILATVLHGTKEVLKHHRNVLIETPARHKTLRNILHRIGFRDTGLSAYRGNRTEMVIYLI
jgi:hypothetical protein